MRSSSGGGGGWIRERGHLCKAVSTGSNGEQRVDGGVQDKAVNLAGGLGFVHCISHCDEFCVHYVNDNSFYCK